LTWSPAGRRAPNKTKPSSRAPPLPLYASESPSSSSSSSIAPGAAMAASLATLVGFGAWGETIPSPPPPTGITATVPTARPTPSADFAPTFPQTAVAAEAAGSYDRAVDVEAAARAWAAGWEQAWHERDADAVAAL